MQTVNLSGLARRVTVLPPLGSTATTVVASDAPVIIYRSKADRRKKQSRGLRGIERLIRSSASARSVYAKTYLDRHERSNRKKRDGWLRDRRYNVVVARRKAMKRLRRGLEND